MKPPVIVAEGLLGRHLVGVRSFFWGLEITEVPTSAFSTDRRAPPAFLERDAPETGLVGCPLSAVNYVLGARCVPQVSPAIVGPVEVDMVNVVFRPTAGHPQPSQPRNEIFPKPDLNAQIT